MNTINYKHLGMYLLVGIISGGLCVGITTWGLLPTIVNDHIPAGVLAVAIVVAVRYISVIQFRSGWLSALILTMACLIGWYLAIEFGFRYYTTQIYNPVSDWYLVVSGTIGGASVAIGFTLTWNLSRPRFAIAVITMAGMLGGILLFILALIEYMETLSLFVVWQSILLLGISISAQIESAKSSVE